MGRIPYLETPQAALQMIRPKHKEIIRRLVCGQTQREIARDLNLNEGRLSIICNSPLFKIELGKMERDVRTKAIDSVGDVTARIAKLQGPALDVLEDIVINPENKDIGLGLRQKTAVTVLEMAGAKKNKNEDGMSDFAQFISEAYNQAKQRALDKLDQGLSSSESGNGDSDQLLLEDNLGLNAGAIDISGEVLNIDDADDAALIAYQLPEEGEEEEKAEPSALDELMADADRLEKERLERKTREEAVSVKSCAPTSQVQNYNDIVSSFKPVSARDLVNSIHPSASAVSAITAVEDVKLQTEVENIKKEQDLERLLLATMKKYGLKAEELLAVLDK
jgi:hypothetical protein